MTNITKQLGTSYGTRRNEQLGLGVLIGCVASGMRVVEAVQVLNNLGITTRQGKQWTRWNMHRVYSRVHQIVRGGKC